MGFNIKQVYVHYQVQEWEQSRECRHPYHVYLPEIPVIIPIPAKIIVSIECVSSISLAAAKIK